MTKIRNSQFDQVVKAPTHVTQAKAGVHKHLKRLDSGFYRNDGPNRFLTILGPSMFGVLIIGI